MRRRALSLGITAAGTAAHWSPIRMQDELIVGAHVDIEMLWCGAKINVLSEVKYHFVSLWSTRRGDPLRLPELFVISRILRGQMTAYKQQRDYEE